MSIIDQWETLKRQHPAALLLFQLGDFYELFFEDAKVAAAALSLNLTRRGRHLDSDVPMCGVPVASAAAHVARLTALGHSVAIADQRRTLGSTGIDRAVTRVSTPATSIDDLSPLPSRHLVAIVRSPIGYAWAAADVSRMHGETGHCAEADLVNALGALSPVEILAQQDVPLGPFARYRVAGQAHGEPGATTRRASSRARAEHAAVASVTHYLSRMQGGALASAVVFEPHEIADTMAVDLMTRSSLGIEATGRAALPRSLDRTQTPMGSRLLEARLIRPCRDVKTIDRRHAAWEAFAMDDRRHRARAVLADLPDFERAIPRFVSLRPNPRDFGAIREGLRRARLASQAGLMPEVSPALDPLFALLADALDDTTSAVVRRGYDAALDQARDLGGDTRSVLAGLQHRMASQTRAAGLKIRFHAQFGYVVEVSSAQIALVQADASYILRQGLASAARFSHPELTRLGDRIAEATAEASARETAIIASLGEAIAAQAPALLQAAAALAELDVAQSSATLAQEGVWCRPDITNGVDFSVSALRHPELAASLTPGSFVPNDCDLSSAQRLILLTGPNMAGKSTFLRQNAIAVILAQAGIPVPAERARIGIVDALFSRVGAADDPARGRSTFMVEMLEVAAILSNATPRSFVIVDEVGRGTATQDGLAIAQAVLEALHDTVRCRTIFATHFLELGTLCAGLAALQPCAMRVRQAADGIVFLHEIVPGAANRSWGVHVASLAGIPAAIVARATRLLAAAERSRPVQELPLFAEGLRDPMLPSDLPAGTIDPVRAALDAADLDAMSPRDALEMLYSLKGMLAE